MSRCLGLPTLDLCLIKPMEQVFDVAGASIEGGRNVIGETISIGISGGGVITGNYEQCVITKPEQHEYINWLGARLNSSTRFINVPIKSDLVGPFPVIDGSPRPTINGIPHSDGSLFSDDSGYSQSTVFGRFAQGAPVNAGQIVIDIVGASRQLRWSDWFSVYHAEKKGWRAYRYWEASEPVNVTASIEGASYSAQRYTLAIAPALRAAVSAGDRIEFARPRFVGKFPSDFTLPWRARYRLLPIHISLQFAEAF